MKVSKLSPVFLAAFLALTSCVSLKKHPEKSKKIAKNDIVQHFLNEGKEIALTEKEFGWTNDLITQLVDYMDEDGDGVISSRNPDEEKAHADIALYMGEGVAIVVSTQAREKFEFQRSQNGRGGIIFVHPDVLPSEAVADLRNFMRDRGKPYLDSDFDGSLNQRQEKSFSQQLY